jgi:hypothetical protein
MDAFETLGAALLGSAPPSIGLPPDAVLPFTDFSTTIAWSLAAALLCSAAALATQVEALRLSLQRRVHAVRAAAQRLLPPRRSRAGGRNGRVPPRSAAGSPPL